MTKVVIGGLVAGREWALTKYLDGLAGLNKSGFEYEYLFVRDRAVELDTNERSPLVGLDKLPHFVNFDDCHAERGFLDYRRPNYSYERLGVMRNLWLDYASARFNPDFVLFMDSDVVIEPDGLQYLERTHDRLTGFEDRFKIASRVIVFAPLRNSTNEKVFNFMWRTDDSENGARFRRIPPKGEIFTRPFQVDLSGAVMFIPRNCHDSVRWFGNDHKRIGEDFGFAETCRDNGIELVIDPDIRTVHYMKQDELPLIHEPGDISRAYV